MNANNGLKSFALVAALFLLLSWLRLDPGSDAQRVSTDGGTADETTAETVLDDVGIVDPTLDPTNPDAVRNSRTGEAAAKKTKTGTALATSKTNLQCAPGRNGGETDTGVSASKIRLATTAVLDGQAKSLLEHSPIAMKAVIDKVNRAGGICGRLLSLEVRNDGFDAATGLRYLKNFIDEGYFAFPVVPSAEGLGQAILNGEISKAKVPVIGTDGMRNEQYTDAYVWPVASATVTTMRVMAKYGYTNRQAKRFAIVYDEKYKFGKEGKDAFVDQVTKMGGVMADPVGLNPDDSSYATKISDFNKTCTSDNPCDMVALLLLPETAKKWLAGKPNRGLKYTAGAQTLFTDRFGQDCVQQLGDAFCHGIAVWTGYNPPIGPLASRPGVAAYVNDVRAVSPGIDVNNQFIEGAYLGMSVFVEALKKVGPDLTRERLRAAMDTMTYTSDLASELNWKAGQHAANVRSQAFSISASQNTFRGWANEGTGFLLDPAHGG